ncbi:MAG: 30S ribosomal protein S16 [Patescibacteria group bacterium]|jgi:small subunit ribosomal protein S16
MVSIRLKRVGKKGSATFRFVVSDKRKDTIGPALEILGSYNPHVNPPAIQVKADRVQYWLSKGAQPSASVHNLLVTAGALKAEKVIVAKAKKPKEEVKPEAKAAPKAESKPEVKPEAAKPEVKAEVKVEDPAPQEKIEEKKAEEPVKS